MSRRDILNSKQFWRVMHSSAWRRSSQQTAQKVVHSDVKGTSKASLKSLPLKSTPLGGFKVKWSPTPVLSYNLRYSVFLITGFTCSHYLNRHLNPGPPTCENSLCSLLKCLCPSSAGYFWETDIWTQCFQPTTDTSTVETLKNSFEA